MAVRQKDGSFQLFGYKWFSSATDSDMTLTLARIVDKDGNSIQVGTNLLLILKVVNPIIFLTV